MVDFWHHNRKIRLKNPTWVKPDPDWVRHYSVLRVWRFTCHRCRPETRDVSNVESAGSVSEPVSKSFLKQEHLVWQGMTYHRQLGPLHLVVAADQPRWEMLLRKNSLYGNTSRMSIYVGQYTKTMARPVDVRLDQRLDQFFPHDPALS